MDFGLTTSRTDLPRPNRSETSHSFPHKPITNSHSSTQLTMQLGVHFALTDAQAGDFVSAKGDNTALARLLQHLESLEESNTILTCHTDKAWDPISCALAPSGSDRDPDDWPWTGAILGAEDLHDSEGNMIVGYTPPEKVEEVAAALEEMLEEGSFVEAYTYMPEELRNAEYGDQEREYAMSSLVELAAFFKEAATKNLHVVFHVDI